MKARSSFLHKEALNEGYGFHYTVKEVLLKKKTRYQTLEVYDTVELGRALLLDGITQVVEKDEFMYHELLVHPTMTVHPKPQSVLLIGGGDGGTSREILKHSSVNLLDHVDLDEEVIRVAQAYFPSISAGAFDHPKLNLIIGDGRQFLEEKSHDYDVILMDMTDPIGPSRALYTVEFFRLVKNALRSKGLFAMHTSSPLTQRDLFKRLQRTLSHVFTKVTCFYHYIQMYGTLWTVAVCSDRYDLSQVRPSLITRRLHDRKVSSPRHPLKLFNAETFCAMQVIYPYMRSIRNTKVPLIRDVNLNLLSYQL